MVLQQLLTSCLNCCPMTILSVEQFIKYLPINFLLYKLFLVCKESMYVCLCVYPSNSYSCCMCADWGGQEVWVNQHYWRCVFIVPYHHVCITLVNIKYKTFLD